MEILINNDKCEVKDIKPYIWKVITDRFTFEVPGARFSPAYRSGKWKGTKCFFDRNVLSTGLLPILIEMLDQYEVPYTLIDNRTDQLEIEPIPHNFKVGEKVLRDYQVDAANSIINNTLSTIAFNRGILHMATNSGKTATSQAIMMQIIQKLNEEDKILFIVPTQELLFQTKQNFEKDFPGIFIGTIGAGKWSEGIITVALVPTLSKNVKEKKFKDFSKSVRAVIVDEVQHASSETYQKVLKQMTNANIRIGLTGTIPDKEIEKHLVFGSTGTPTMRISNDFLIELEASARPICYFIEIREPNLGRIYDYQEEYFDGIVNNTVRNDAIEKIVNNERKTFNSNILILVERTEHGQILKDTLENNGYGVIDFTHGSRSNKARQKILANLKEGKINVLIATSVLDEGVDADNINAIIYARGQKSPRKLLQGLGRGLRKKKDGSNLRFYDFLDFTGKDLKLHTLERYTVLKDEGFKVETLNISEINEVGNNNENI